MEKDDRRLLREYAIPKLRECAYGDEAVVVVQEEGSNGIQIVYTSEEDTAITLLERAIKTVRAGVAAGDGT